MCQHCFQWTEPSGWFCSAVIYLCPYVCAAHYLLCTDACLHCCCFHSSVHVPVWEVMNIPLGGFDHWFHRSLLLLVSSAEMMPEMNMFCCEIPIIFENIHEIHICIAKNISFASLSVLSNVLFRTDTYMDFFAVWIINDTIIRDTVQSVSYCLIKYGMQRKLFANFSLSVFFFLYVLQSSEDCGSWILSLFDLYSISVSMSLNQ